MNRKIDNQRRGRAMLRAVIEIAFIVFLFYSNLLMGEFTAAHGPGKTLSAALGDVITGKNLMIALVSATIGYLVVEFLRRRF